VRAPASPPDPRVLVANLGAGETEALVLALQVEPDRVLLDDLKARRLGTSLGLPIMGTAGILLEPKHAGLVPAVRPGVEALLRVGLCGSPHIVQQILTDAPEES
jgi:predicted nucleic acid-binding protein